MKVMRELENMKNITVGERIVKVSKKISLLKIYDLQEKKFVENLSSVLNYNVFKSDNSLTCN